MPTKRLLSHQAKMLQAPHLFPEIKNFFLLAGYGAGKSNSLIDCYFDAVERLQGRKDSNGNDPRIMLASSTISFLERSVLLNLEQILKQTGSKYKWNKKNNIIRIGNVDTIIVPTENPDQIFGYDVALALIDELDELPQNTAMEAVAAISQRLRQSISGFRSPWMSSFSTSQGQKGIFQIANDFREKGIGHMIIHASTRDNIYLPKDYVDALYASMSPNEARCYLDGELVPVANRRVFPDYEPSRNRLDYDFYPLFLTDPDYADIPIYIAQDFNSFGNNAVAFAVIDGAIVAVKDYELADIREAGSVFRTDFPTQPLTWIPDVSDPSKFEFLRVEFKSVYGIAIPEIRHNPHVNDRIMACNSLFYMSRMFVCPVCESLHLSLLTHQRNRKTGEPDKGGQGAPDHKTDCVGYAVSWLLRNNSRFYDLYSITFGRRFGIGNRGVSHQFSPET